MGFEKVVKRYSCGCYNEYSSHDFFNYEKDHHFINVCGRHTMATVAKQDEYKKEDERFIFEESMEVLVRTMKPNDVIKYLKQKKILSRKDEENMLQIPSDRARTRELMTVLIRSSIPSLHQMKVALIKTGQSELLQYLARSKNEDEDIMKAFDGKCFIHLQHDVYVTAVEYKGQMYIHIRHYEQRE